MHFRVIVEILELINVAEKPGSAQRLVPEVNTAFQLEEVSGEGPDGGILILALQHREDLRQDIPDSVEVTGTCIRGMEINLVESVNARDPARSRMDNGTYKLGEVDDTLGIAAEISCDVRKDTVELKELLE